MKSVKAKSPAREILELALAAATGNATAKDGPKPKAPTKQAPGRKTPAKDAPKPKAKKKG